MENIILKLSIALVPIMLAIVCHEVAHGFIAWRYGDPTARMLGRLTLNPVKHIDLVGSILVPGFLFLSNSGFLFGWAKPVPVVYENLRNPKRDMIWVAAAGPIVNLILAVLSAVLLRVITGFLNPASSADSSRFMVIEPIVLMLAYSIKINLLLAIFNMFPLPPLDGGRVLSGLLPWKQAHMLARIEPYGFMIIMFLIFFTGIFSYINTLMYFGIKLLAGPQAGLVLGIFR